MNADSGAGIWTTGPIINPKHCEDALQINPERPPFWAPTTNLPGAGGRRGYRWADFYPLYTQMNTMLPPNSKVCLSRGHTSDGVCPPSSYHQGGAHILMADGAVIFMTESVEAGDSRAGMVWRRNGMQQSVLPPGSQSPYGPWGALGTASMKETIEEQLNQ